MKSVLTSVNRPQSERSPCNGGRLQEFMSSTGNHKESLKSSRGSERSREIADKGGSTINDGPNVRAKAKSKRRARPAPPYG